MRSNKRNCKIVGHGWGRVQYDDGGARIQVCGFCNARQLQMDVESAYSWIPHPGEDSEVYATAPKPGLREVSDIGNPMFQSLSER